MTSDQYTELVAFLGRRFDSIDREFVEVRRHAAVLFEEARDERAKMAEGIDVRFVNLEQKVTSLDTKVTALDSKVTSVDSRVTSLEFNVASLASNVASLDSRTGSVESTLASLDASVRGTLADHEARLRALE